MSKKASRLFYYIVLIMIGCLGTEIKNCEAENGAKHIVVHNLTHGTLFNPNMGLVIPAWMNKIDKNAWYLKYGSVAYNRWTWADIEPKKGIYRFDKISRWIKKCRNVRLRSAFRIMSTTIGMTGTPSYIFDCGVPGVRHKSGTQIDPVYWNQLYLELYDEFVLALGKALDGGKGIEFIDLGGIGVWGEMHLGLHIKDMWTKKELLKYGYSREKYLIAYKSMINAYKRSFPDTTLILNISKYDDIAEYAAKNGIGLRFDGLNPKSKMEHISYEFNKYGLGDNINNGVPCIYEFAQKYSEINELERCVEKILESPISYLHINLGDLSLVSEEIKMAIQSLSTKIGYRYVLKESILDKELSVPKNNDFNLSIKQHFINTGIAPSYRNYKLAFFMTKNKKVVLKKVFYPNPSVKSWLPGRNIQVKSTLKIPNDLPDGKYRLKMAIIDSKDSTKKIELGIGNKDIEGRYDLSILELTTMPNNNWRNLKMNKLNSLNIN